MGLEHWLYSSASPSAPSGNTGSFLGPAASVSPESLLEIGNGNSQVSAHRTSGGWGGGSVLF